jgi:uncharacterized membrane protein
MDTTKNTLENLIEKAETYSKTSLELYKLNTIYKSADVLSTLAIKLVITIVLIIVALMLNIGLALWFGSLLGETFYGFFIIAAFYVLLSLIIYFFKNEWIKHPVSDFIISQTLKKIYNEN